MAKERTLQLLYGTTAANDAYTGSVAELTVDTTLNELRLHDGTTAGGHVIGGDAIDNSTITKNSAQQLQTVGTVNANTTVGSVTPLKVWQGTEQQWTTGGGSKTWYNWQTQPTETWEVDTLSDSALYGTIVYGNGIYLINCGNKVYYSTDATNWSFKNLPITASDLAFGNGVFVGVNTLKNACYSTDGENWTQVSSITTNGVYNKITFLNGLFIAYSTAVSASSRFIAYSTDGTSWTEVALSFITTYLYVTSIAYGNGKYILALANDASYQSLQQMVYQSENLTNWTVITTIPEPVANKTHRLFKIVYTDKFVIFGINSDNTNYIWYSTDGTTWEYKSGLPTMYKMGFASGNGTYLICQYNSTGTSGSISKYYYSTDCLNWQGGDIPNVSNINPTSVLYDGEKFLVSCLGPYSFRESEFDTSNKLLEYTFSLDKCYTEDASPTTSSTVYSEPGVMSAKTITSVSGSTITLSDTYTYTYNSGGNITTYQNVSEANPDYLCFIDGVGIKRSNTSYTTGGGGGGSYTAGAGLTLSGSEFSANLVTSVSSSSTDNQIPTAKLFYDTCGDIESLINAL